MIVLKIIGWVLLGILALIILALFVRVGVQAEYSEKKTTAAITWLFLKIPLYPTKKKPKKDKETGNPESGISEDEKESTDETSGENSQDDEFPEDEIPEDNTAELTSEKQDTKTEEKPVKKKKKKESFLHILYRTNGIDGILLLLKRILSYTGTFIGNLIRGVVVDEFDLDMACVKKGDAAATAIYYGEVCSALFPMLGAIASECRMKKHDINVYPDYLARYSDASFFVKLHITPIYLIGITVAYGVKLVFKVVLRMFVKIFMPDKNNKAGNSDITKNKEKSGTKV